MTEIKENMKNFRVKVDLSQFYNDERKLSYIYIDIIKINNVLHLLAKIQNMFGIIQPLYLAVNDVFLPVNEDIRILKEDEVVVVQTLDSGSNCVSNVFNSTVKEQKINDINAESKSQCEKFGSDNTDFEIFDDAKVDVSASDVVIGSHVVESEIPRRKRKRIRRRKKSNKGELSSSISDIQQNGCIANHQVAKINADKPNHLKFHWNEFDECEEQNHVSDKNSLSSKPIIRSSEIVDLETLLSLRKNRVPVTFSGQRRSTRNSDTSSVSFKSSNRNASPEKKRVSPVPMNNSFSIPDFDYTKINVDDYPLYEKEFEINDIIAFQTLVLNESYCPTLSDYIVAKVISKDLRTKNYSFSILVGHESLKTPEGKFALPTDNTEEGFNQNQLDNPEILTLNYSHVNKPHLIHRPSPPLY